MAESASLRPGWTVRRFDEIAVMVNDRVDNPEDAGVDRYVGLEHLDPDSLKIRRWGSPSDVTATKLRFRAGDIIFGRRRVYQRKLAVADFEGICSAHAMVLRAKPDAVLPEFLPFFMQSKQFMNRALEISVGSLSPTINWKTLAKQEFALPPLKEQRRIATLLTESTSVIEHQHLAKKRLLQIMTAIRERAFDPASSNTIPLANLCDQDGIKIGPFGAQLHQSDYVPEGVPVVMPKDMVDNRISVADIACVSEAKAQSLATHRLKPHDILLPRRGELDRRAYVSEENDGWLCGTGAIRIRVRNDVPSLGVLHALASRHVVRWLTANAVGSTMLNLNTKIVSRIPVALPPMRALERTLDCLAQAETSLSEIKARINAASAVRDQLLSRMAGGA